MEKRIRRLTEPERQAILKASPLEAGLFQGDGFHVFRKAEPDFDKAYVTGLGEIMAQDTEDWIIRQYLLAEDEISSNRRGPEI